MAVFMVNGCKFRNCSLIFETLAELIQHIEEAHIQDVEREDDDRPQSIAMSKVLRFYGGAKPKKSLLAIATSPAITKKSRQRNNSIMLTSASIRSLTPTSSEYDFDEEDNAAADSYSLGGGGLECLTELESSAEQQWTNQLILKMISNKTDADDEKEKSFICPIQGCRKRYKNIGGAKLHIKTAHKRESRVTKSISKCFCGKSFQTAKQLELHAESEHSLSTFGIIHSGDDNSSLTTSSSSDPKLSTTVKDEPTTLTRDTSKGHPLSIIHPITISGGVLLTPATARHFKNVNKGDILVAHRIATTSSSGGQNKQMVASLVSTSSSSLVTPPTTPQRASNLSLSTSIKPKTPTLTQKLEEQQQKALNEKVAQVLTAAKQAMEADAAKTTPSHQPTIVTLQQ